jgi:glycosyltransferase involved in cell wall biosynthesis
MPSISVILSTYNRPDALEMVLRSLEAQTCNDSTMF